MPRSKGNSIESYVSNVARQVYRQLDNYDSENGPRRDFYVLNTYSDAVILEDMDSDKMFEVPYSMSFDGTVTFGALKEVEEAYVLKMLADAGIDLAAKRNANRSIELAGPIVMKNAAKRIAHGAVLVPGEPDHDGEILTADKIETVAHEWLAAYRNMDLMHTLNNVATPVESYITPQDIEVEAYGEKVLLPKGTWVIASKIQGEETWGRIENNELTGYSVMGIRRSTLDSAIKSKENVALKRTLLRDLGEDWVAAAVSIVDEPCVPKAKFFAFKSRAEEPEVEEQKPFFARLKGLFTAEKSGRRFSDNTYNKLKTAYEDIKELYEEAESERASNGSSEKSINEEVESMNQEEIKALVETAVKSAVEAFQVKVDELGEAIKSLEKPAEPEAPETPVEPETPAEPEANEDLESFKSEVADKLEKIEKKLSVKSRALTEEDELETAEKSKGFGGRDMFGRKLS